MSTKKIKLKTSVANINAKVKKKKQSTKLKIILADPHKYLIPTLSTDKATALLDVVQLEMERTGLAGKEFAKRFGITFGMASSLRAISGRETACVLVSKSVKPRFILQQIAYFTKQRNSKAPVFLVSNLEELSKTMFGIKSIVMTFGISTSPKIANWIAEQSSTSDEKNTCVTSPHDSVVDTTKSSPIAKVDLNSILLRKANNGERMFVPPNVKSYELQEIDNRIKITSDFMSFSTNTSYARENIQVSDAESDEGRILYFTSGVITFGETPQNLLIPSTNKNKNRQSKMNPNSYAKLKTLTLLSNKQKSKKKD